MASDRYEVEILPRTEKDLNKLRQDRDQAVREVLQLEANPLLGHTLRGNRRGARSLEFNLRGGGAYRAVYVVLHDDRVCIVFLVGSHENTYGEAERRYKALQKR